MGAYLNKPELEKFSEDDKTGKMKYGASSMQGWRTSQEDAHNCCLEFDQDSSLFAVYDGHGGAEVAEYTAEKFPEFLKSIPAYRDSKTAEAMQEAFLQFDATLVQQEVIAILRDLAGINEEDEEGDAEEAEKLSEEADMPMEELLRRYGYMQAGAHMKRATDQLRRKKENIQSPMIRAKKDPSHVNGDVTADDNIKLKLEDQLVNGHSDSTATPDSTETSEAKADICSDITSSKAGSLNSTGDLVKCSSSDSGIVLDKGGMDQAEDGDVSSSTVDKTAVCSDTAVGSSAGGGSACDSSAGGSSTGGGSAGGGSAGGGSIVDSSSVESSIGGSSAGGSSTVGSSAGSSSAGGSSTVGSSAGGSSAGGSSAGGGSSAVPDSGGSSSANVQGSDEPMSSSGRTRVKRSGVIPKEGEDESSFDEDEDDTEEEVDSDEDPEPWKSGSDDDESDEEDEVTGPFVEGEDEEDGEDEVNCGGEEPGRDSGCTAVVALMQKNQLYVANAGDSRCVLCRAGKAIDMSIDHKPEDDIERTRIEKGGGRITRDGRVNGGLNLSRAIGDHCYKQNSSLPDREQVITALPDIQSTTIETDDEFMVLACDGIWNVMSSQDVVTFVRERLKAGVDKLSSICEEMFDMCLAPNTHGDGTGCDNMTCIIVSFADHFQTLNKTDRLEATPAQVIDSGMSSEAQTTGDKATDVAEDPESSVISSATKSDDTPVPVAASIDSSEIESGNSSTVDSDCANSSKRKAEDDSIDNSDSKKSRTDEVTSNN